MDKIICVGKNYLEHAKELGDVVPERPVIFLKPPSVLREARGNERVKATLPSGQGSVHHECELIFKVKNGGYRLSDSQAESCLDLVTIGLDMTLRDLQASLKKSGHPWTTSKVFPDSAIVGPWMKVSELPYLTIPFYLKVNGKERQKGSVEEMMFSPAKCLAWASQHFPVQDGDLLFTGTPAGVGPVTSGDVAELTFGKIQFSVEWTAQ